MPDPTHPLPIVMAEDDPEDRLLTRDAFQECRLRNPLYFVADGVELLDYLNHRGEYADPTSSPRPGIILLDLNMPRMGGFEALEEIKKDPSLRKIPVVIMTTSRAEEDVVRSYELGVSGFVSKPITFDGLVEVIRTLGQYWFEIVALPAGEE